MRIRGRRFGSVRGNSLVEFALASLILVPVFAGTFQFGYSFYIYNHLVTQMRAGARYGSLHSFQCSNANAITDYKTKVKNLVRYGNPSGTGTILEPGLTADQVQVDIVDADGNPADKTHVPVSITVKVVNYSIDAIFTTFAFNGKPFVTFPYIGRYAPAEP